MTAPPRAPGVYLAQGANQRRFVPLSLWPAGIPGFVGVAERGPLNDPVRLTSEKHFASVFGEQVANSYLSTAVRGFFDNGGKVCYVLRVAHLVRRRGEESAKAAEITLNGGDGEPSLIVRAANPGEWGNRVRLRAQRQEPRVSTFLTLDLRPGDTAAVIKSTLGLQRGTLVRIHDGSQEVYRTITGLSGKTISWANEAPLEEGFRSGAPTFIEPIEFTIEAAWRDKREVYRNLSLSPFADSYVERVLEGSRLIQVEDLRNETLLHGRVPVSTDDTLLQGGTDGLLTVTPEDFIGANIGPNERYGVAAYEAVDEVDLLVAPDLMWALHHSRGFRTEKDVEVVQQAMVSQCERLRTRFAILDFPDPVEHKFASQWRLLFDSAYAAFYYPWIEVPGTDTPTVLVPPSGHVAGIYARCDAGAGPYRAPANEDVAGVIDLGRNLTDGDIGLMTERGINPLRPMATRGIRVWGARTTSSDPQWRYVNVRRVMNAVIASVERGLQWAVFETNQPLLWKRITRDVTSFLLDLYQAGYFKGPSPEHAFFVKCDEETNPPAVRDAGQVVIECGIAPVRPAEFFTFRVDADVGSGAGGEQ